MLLPEQTCCVLKLTLITCFGWIESGIVWRVDAAGLLVAQCHAVVLRPVAV